MPTPTDLVTDLPADFEVFGQAVDSSMADLLGGTTGQILAKNSNTNMDFVWITNDVGDITAVTAGTGISGGGTSGSVTITNSMATEIAAKGDLIAGTGSQTFDNLTAGANYSVLSAQSGQTTGLQWRSDVTAYTPTWTADGGSPAIGNGQLAGYWQRYGKLCMVRLFIQMGSTTTKGTGGWYFSLPFTSVTGAANLGIPGNAYVEDFAAAGYRSTSYVGSTGADFFFITAGGGQVGAATPFTFATNDYVSGTIVYEVA